MLKIERIVITIICIVVVILGSILISKKTEKEKVNRKKENLISGEWKNEEVDNSVIISANKELYDEEKRIISKEEMKDVISDIKNRIGSKTNKVVLIVNGEKITEKEIALIDFQINNQYVNSKELKDAVDKTIKEYVILQDARKKKIELTNEEVKNIEKRVQGFIKKTDEETSMIIDALNMNYNEVLKFYSDRTKKLEIISKWNDYITDAIINNAEINIDSQEFKNKYEEYKKNNSKSIKIVLELIELYQENLKDKAKIEYID